jgi:hypothetical protein
MHPKMISALASEVQRDRVSERHQVHLRALAVASRVHGIDGARAVRGVGRRLRGRTSLRPRLS